MSRFPTKRTFELRFQRWICLGPFFLGRCSRLEMSPRLWRSHLAIGCDGAAICENLSARMRKDGRAP
ncbi:MAG: hypothetical protein DMF14_10820 [Verrucomicrobia bacterium]|nr:MAG: hypothetical protein DMF23_09620 [Verrucomicrobiota bacterium]PYL90140.1 MAG: hypothetical protein DMF14_10820 [Verrucomicrobiota bacterium]